MKIRIGLISLGIFLSLTPLALAGGGLIVLWADYPNGGNIASPGQTVTIKAEVHLTNDKLPDDPENICKQCKVELKIRDQIADTQISQDSDKTDDNGVITGHVRVDNQHIVYFYAEAHLPNGQSYTSLYQYMLDFDGPILLPSPSPKPSIKPTTSSKPVAKSSLSPSPSALATPQTSTKPVSVVDRKAEQVNIGNFIVAIQTWLKSLFATTR